MHAIMHQHGSMGIHERDERMGAGAAPNVAVQQRYGSVAPSGGAGVNALVAAAAATRQARNVPVTNNPCLRVGKQASCQRPKEQVEPRGRAPAALGGAVMKEHIYAKRKGVACSQT